MGDCTKELLEEIASTKQKIENFSISVQGLPDDLILFKAEDLVESIKNMIEQKQIIKENMNK